MGFPKWVMCVLTVTRGALCTSGLNQQAGIKAQTSEAEGQRSSPSLGLQGCMHSCLPQGGQGGGWELKWLQINFNSLSKPSPGCCKPSTDTRLPKTHYIGWVLSTWLPRWQQFLLYPLPSIPPCCLLYIQFHWNLFTLSSVFHCLCCFHTAIAELNDFDRVCIDYKTKNVYYLALYRKSLSITTQK